MPTADSYLTLPADTLFFPSEPFVEADEVQGNVLPGFAASQQHYLFVSVTDATAFKSSLRARLPSVASLRAVLAARTATAPPTAPRWLNVAFTFDGLVAIGAPVSNTPLDRAFTEGMTARAVSLGDADPATPDAAWHVGRPGQALHALLVLASDSAAELDAFAGEVRGLAGFEVLYEVRGDTTVLPSAREHFGYTDGRAQPGVLGWFLASDGSRRALSPRRNAHNRGEGFPGQALVAPERVLTGRDPDAPSWLRNGSYLVARLLAQHVGAMHRFVFDAATALGVQPALIASRILGRWPGGAPTLRADHDDLRLGGSPCEYNDFRYLRPGATVDTPLRAEDCASTAPPSRADPLGAVCPFSAHIRKSNPRDDEGWSPSERAEITADQSRTRVILRRSMPYGPASPSTFDAPVADAPDVERGLVFVCYQSSIERQFEFIQRGLVQDADAPRPDSGHDALIGQSTAGTPRRFSLGTLPDGRSVRCTGVPAWVTTRGGGYFFAPSIPALATLLA